MSASKEELRTATAKGPGRPRDASKEAAIVKAAQDIFMQRGFDGASVDAIAEAAGVAKATVYARFKDKEGLMRAAIMAKCDEFLDAAHAEADSTRSPRQALREFAHRFIDLVTDPDAVAMHALMMDAGKSGPQLPALFFESAVLPTCRRLAAYLDAETARGRLSVKDSEAAVWRFLGMVKSQEHMRALLGLTSRPRADIDAYVETCVEAFLAVHAPR